MNNYAIRLASSDADRACAYSLRYELYVEHQRLFSDVADHEQRWLRDKADDHAAIWVAELEGEVVGTGRLHWGKELPFDAEVRETFDVDAFTDIIEESEIGVASRLLVRPAHRDTLVSVLLVVNMMQAVVERGTELVLADCEPHLVNTWIRLGFRPFGLCEHPTNGTLVRLALIAGDYEYTRSLGSPLAPVMKKWSKAGDSPQRLAARVSKSQRIVSEMKDREQFWAAVEQTVSLEQLAGLLGDLSVEELNALLGNSLALDCDPESALIRKGHASRTLYVLLTGSLEVWDEGRKIVEVEAPGEVLGEVAFFSGSERMSDVLAGTRGARVLALSERNLQKLIQTQGAGAAKFLLMLTRGLSNKLRERSRPPDRATS